MNRQYYIQGLGGHQKHYYPEHNERHERNERPDRY